MTPRGVGYPPLAHVGLPLRVGVQAQGCRGGVRHGVRGASWNYCGAFSGTLRHVARSDAERARLYRARKRRRALTEADGVALARFGNQSARRSGIHSADLEQAVDARLSALPQYLGAAAFQDAVRITFRRVERAQRLADYVSGLSDEESVTARKAGGTSPEEQSRHADDSALRGLSMLGLVPASAAKFAARLEQSLQPDLARMAAEERLRGLVDDGDA